ncbi:C-terminal domain of CinA type S [hydrothermal vent metagenome]|uniref:C-terminal domain of CinA type S n=1 Tax=hydrothermal vent metagenome TaxID=652676 RepID=A0A160VID9_9ZZZZ
MNVGLITIGNELLSGFTTDTNSAWIGQSVLEVGAEITWHVTIGDQYNHITAALDQVPEDIKVVLVTGGLGPTHDDITQKTLFKYFDVQPVFDEDYWNILNARMVKRARVMPEINKNQAIRPNKGSVIPNNSGSARGLHLNNDRMDVFAMPGVHREMKDMMSNTIIPWIHDKTKSKIYVRTLRTTGAMESVLAEKLVDVTDDTRPVTVAFLPQFTGVDIRLTCPKKNPLIEIEEKIRDRVDKYIYATGIVNLEETVGDMLVKCGYTISTAESCTGGLLGHRFTNVPGSSTYYLGGVVSYSDDIKMKTLGVQENTLQEFGAVSKQTATEMAQGVRDLFGSDLAIAVTGIAGPGGGTAEKPVGLVYITLVHNDTVWAKEFKFFTDRKLNKQLSSQVALNMVRIHLLNG